MILGQASKPARGIAALLLAAIVTAATAGTSAGAPRAGAPRFEQTPLVGRVLVVDPGHGGIDGGCVADGHLEKSTVLPVAQELTRLLRAAGARVGLTRNQDMELGHMHPGPGSRYHRDLAMRVAVSRRLGPDLQISLHANASRDPRAQGAMVFYQPGRPDSRRVALWLLEALKALMPGDQNAALPGDFFVLRQVPYTAVLVELGFLTSPVDRKVLVSPEGQARLAHTLYEALVRYYSEEGRSVELERHAPRAAGAAPALLVGPADLAEGMSALHPPCHEPDLWPVPQRTGDTGFAGNSGGGRVSVR